MTTQRRLYTILVILAIILTLYVTRHQIAVFYFSSSIASSPIKNLEQVLRNADTNVPYFRDSHSIRPAIEALSETNNVGTVVQKCPYIDKERLIAYNDNLLDCNLTRCKLPSGSSFQKVKSLWGKCAVSQSTGGTSGKSTHVWMSWADSRRYIHSFLRSFRENGWKPGQRVMVFYPAGAYFTDTYVESNGALKFLLNVNFVPFSQLDEASMARFVAEMNTWKPDIIVVFPFVMLQLCRYILSNNILVHNPLYVNLSGEFLLECSKRRIKQVFPDARIELTYGAVEFGEIAHEVTGAPKGTYRVFDDLAYVESLDGKLVITSFVNRSFPIIRYVTEDVGQVVHDPNDTGKQLIVNFEGKMTNVIALQSGKTISPLSLDKEIEKGQYTIESLDCFKCTINNGNEINYIAVVLPSVSDDICQKLSEEIKTLLENAFGVPAMGQVVKDIEHNFLTKFRLIEAKGLGSEPVGGVYKI